MKLSTILPLLVSSFSLLSMDFTHFSAPDRTILEKSFQSLATITSQDITIPYDVVESRVEQLPLTNAQPYTPYNPLVPTKKDSCFVSYWTSDVSADTIPDCVELLSTENANYTQTPLSAYMIYVPKCDNKDEQLFLQRRAEIQCLHRHYITQKALKYNQQLEAIEKKKTKMTSDIQSLSKQACELYAKLQDSHNTDIDPEIHKLSATANMIIDTIEDEDLRNRCKDDHALVCCCDSSNTNAENHSMNHLQKLGKQALLLIHVIDTDFDLKIQKLKDVHQKKYYLMMDDQQFFYDRAAALVQQNCSPALRYLSSKIKRGVTCIDANHPTYLERFERLKTAAEYICEIQIKQQL